MAILNRSSDELDSLFDCLSHPSRRRIVALLAEANPQSVDEVAREEPDSVVDDSDRAAAELFHAHLPKLDEEGYVSWDRDAGVVERGPRFDRVGPVVRLLYDRRDELPGEWS
ncbi:MAG TPA: hypothetical protein VKA37_06490 [Halobacteriales archaeon]|mgnify:CR=1 FL=1|nr:hypothetical protein [Halobacteriales archaeon]